MSSPVTLPYRLLFTLLSPALLAYTLWQANKGKSWRYLRERCGRYQSPHSSPAPIWLHAASVGEFKATLPLIAALRQRQGNLPIMLSTSTISSARLAAQLLPDVLHVFLPLDWPGAVHNFLHKYRPRCALIVETELWPNLFAACAARHIPLIIINGRLSRRTLHAPRWLKRQYGQTLSLATAILARSEADKKGFLALGAPADLCQVIGNIKFSATTQKATPLQLPRPYILAASTRDGEELLIWRAWQGLKDNDHLLVIVPRHPHRLAEILRTLALPATQIAVRSRQQDIQTTTRVYIADTFGELTGFIAGAELVFMGGSLVPKGGQNILEVAHQGKAVIFGPYMDNFADEARLLLEHQAAIQIANPAELATVLHELLAQPAKCAALGVAAQQLVAQQQDVAMRYAEALDTWCQGNAEEL